ncbi:MAG TPA: glutamate--tRNA ligase [Fimbriimonadaceae bacterium]
MSVRVRYAPSPTGSPHVGNIRTALFCYLYSRHTGGENMIRLEDTDRTRYVPGSEEDIMESLHWVGIEWEEGPDKGGPYAPYRQSERKETGIYQPYIDQLLASGQGYKAFDTPEELAEMRKIQEQNKKALGYFGGDWREAMPEQVAETEKAGKPFVIRLKMPRGRTLSCVDAVRGRIEWDSDTCDDQVMIKADGMPTYHFAAMVDDHLMGITHVIRGEEWISSTPKHVFLLESLGWEPPIFVHTTIIKGKDGSKLSKRHGDTRCLDFRAAGYLPEALVNFIALIGWAPGGDRELMSKAQLIEAFTLDGLQPSPGVFDIDKLRWMNGNYIRALDPLDLGARLEAYVSSEETFEYWLKPEFATEGTHAYLGLLREGFARGKSYALATLPLVQERVHTLADFGEATAFFFNDEPPMDPKAVEKWFGEPYVGPLFDRFILELGIAPKTLAELETIVRDYAAEAGFEKLGPIVHPLRVALTGKTTGPGLFELMEVLGKDRMVARLTRAKGLLKL